MFYAPNKLSGSENLTTIFPTFPFFILWRGR